jgi:hypothetical protein
MRMSYARTIRWLRTCLVGLFALAQIAGVSPLIYEHTLNVFGEAHVGDHAVRTDQARVAPAAPDADHHHGILDVHDQCCALHTLAGPLPAVADVALANPLSVRLAPATLVALADADPPRLDRPPRPMPLI